MGDAGIIVSIRERLLKERNALLDLSTRNRLLNTPLRTRNVRTIEIVDERATEVFRILSSSKSMSFLAGVQLSEADRAELESDDKETGGIPQPKENEDIDERGISARHTDTRLQTRLTSEGLQKRLFDIWYDARTLEEEQGVNILYLAIGLLRWYDTDDSDVARHAPLVLLPVKLERSSAADRFHIKGRGEPPSPNLTLQSKMKAEFGLVIEDFADEDEVDLTSYIEKVAQTTSAKSRWEVLPNAMVLGFFSFAKFLMYRDLDPEHWPETAAIDGHPLVSALLRDGFPETEPLIAEDVAIDTAIPPLELNHVVDADSSQAVAIAEAAGGRTLVVKGPPGTGKSQTITNIIAAAAAKGRKVLFVSEKMAALDVVYRRLRQANLGPLILELHSNKINKRTVLEELRRTKDAAPPPAYGDASVIQKLGETGEKLTRHASRLHTPLQPSGLTPYQIMGRLVSAQAYTDPIEYKLDGASAWTANDLSERQALVAEISERLIELGSPTTHPWRGVKCEALDPFERDKVQKRIVALETNLTEAIATVKIAVDNLGATQPVLLRDLDLSATFLRAAQTLPIKGNLSSLANPAWRDKVGELDDLLKAGQQWMAARLDIDPIINSTGWKADYSFIRTTIVIRGNSLFRFFNGNYRSQIALLRSYLKISLPKNNLERVALIDRIIAAQNAKKLFEEAPDVGDAFGTLWKSESSDWGLLKDIVGWRNEFNGLPEKTWARLANADRDALAKASIQLGALLKEVREELVTTCDTLLLDLQRAFNSESPGQIPLSNLIERLTTWNREIESLSRFIAFASRGRDLALLGVGRFVDAVHDGKLDRKTLPLAFQRSYATELRSTLFSSWPELRAFDGETHTRLVQWFRQLDRARIELAKEQISAKHAEQRPKSAGGIGPLGILNAELAKRRGHLPIRQLLDKAGAAIQQLKPVFMMSPLSVAQFLKPGGLTFDLLVMDEASQIEPVDALGAIARAQQLVVVGDEKQLPPTSFFKKLTGDDEKEEDDDGVAIQAKDAESILDLCLAKGAPHRMLSWHYRSKHQSLIAVSNKEFYENKLYIVPSPYDAIAGMGLKYHLLRDTSYDRGATRTNPKEARLVAEAAIQHAATNPNQSLGIATFSVAQRQMVLKELEILRRAHPETEDFFSGNSLEPFFVKNLENIQGDERDVIFISVGYGKTEEGYLAHSFGPLSGEGGERRLNVLISRAKIRCEVFCNFTGADIDLERTRARGVAALKLFLTFAETGKFGLGESVGDEHDSEFEFHVCERLRSRGYDVKTQIGASGFRVDLAVSDPEKPGRFILGIECDGAQYHSSRSARDRDRLRQQVLEAHGWIIHRIWSTDWYLRPEEELKKIEASIIAAKAEWHERDETSTLRSKAVPLSFEAEQYGDVDIITAVVSDLPPPTFVAERFKYQEADFPVNTSVEPHEAPLADMAAYVVKIVQVEGPIHIEEIATRVRVLWGLKKAGARIRTAVTYAAEIAAQRGLIMGEEFYQLPGQTIRVRDRSEVSSSTLRKPEMLPPQEMDEALLSIVDSNFGAGRGELVQACSRQFGYSSTSAQLRDVFEERIAQLIAAGSLETKGDLLVRKGPPN